MVFYREEEAVMKALGQESNCSVWGLEGRGKKLRSEGQRQEDYSVRLCRACGL